MSAVDSLQRTRSLDGTQTNKLGTPAAPSAFCGSSTRSLYAIVLRAVCLRLVSLGLSAPTPSSPNNLRKGRRLPLTRQKNIAHSAWAPSVFE